METNRSSRRNRRQDGHDPDPLAGIVELSGIALDQTDDAIETRRSLTKRFLREIEREIAEVVRMLRMLGDPWKHGDKTEYEFMRISLDKALTARKKERRARLLEEWKDLLALFDRRRELLREALALKPAQLERELNKEEEGEEEET